MGIFALLFGMPTVVYTILVGICVCYWLLVVGGALGTDLLDGDVAHHGGDLDVSGAAKAIGAAKAAGSLDAGGVELSDVSAAAKALGAAKGLGGGYELDAASAAKALSALDATTAAKALGAAKAIGFDVDVGAAAKAVDAAKAISSLLEASAAAKAASGALGSAGGAEGAAHAAGSLAGAAHGAEGAAHAAGSLAGAAHGAEGAAHAAGSLAGASPAVEVAVGSASAAQAVSGSLAGGAASGGLVPHGVDAAGSATAAAKAAAGELGTHTWKVPLAAKGSDGLPAAVAQDPALRVGLTRHNEAFRRPQSADASGGGLAGFLGLGTVPATVVVSLLSFFGWVGSIALAQTLWPIVALAAGPIPAHLVTLVLAAVASLPFTGLAARPLKKVFGMHGAVERTRVLYGRVCTVLSGRVDARFGQAEFADGGAGLLLNVTCPHENALKKGALAVIVDYDPARDAYEIEPVDWLLPGETAKDAIDPHALERALQAREKQRSRS